MSSPGMLTIQCPSCQRTLPPAAHNCHFCGASLANVARPKAAPKKSYGPAPWIMTLYYCLGGYWIVDGLWAITRELIRMSRPAGNTIPGMEALSFVGIAVGAFAALLGLGLLLKWDWARNLINIFCWIRIVLGVLSLPSLLGISMIFGPAVMIVTLLFTIVGMVAAGVQIWLIGETETFM